MAAHSPDTKQAAPPVPTQIDFDKFQDPLFFLLKAAVTTQEKELDLQGAVAKLEEKLAEAAASIVQVNNTALEAQVARIQADTGNTNQMTADNAQYQLMQTKASSQNQNYNNIVNQGNTMLTTLSQTEAQVLQFCKTAQDNQSNLNQLINQW
jgi:hypothetical protein